MNPTINLTDLADSLAEETGIGKGLAKVAVQNLFRGITKTISENGTVSIYGFGTFKLRERKGRKGRNPKSGDPVEVPPSTVMVFKAVPSLKNLGGKPKAKSAAKAPKKTKK